MNIFTIFIADDSDDDSNDNDEYNIITIRSRRDYFPVFNSTADSRDGS